MLSRCERAHAEHDPAHAAFPEKHPASIMWLVVIDGEANEVVDQKLQSPAQLPVGAFPVIRV